MPMASKQQPHSFQSAMDMFLLGSTSHDQSGRHEVVWLHLSKLQTMGITLEAAHTPVKTRVLSLWAYERLLRGTGRNSESPGQVQLVFKPTAVSEPHVTLRSQHQAGRRRQHAGNFC